MKKRPATKSASDNATNDNAGFFHMIWLALIAAHVYEFVYRIEITRSIGRPSHCSVEVLRQF